jgi:predicted dehydrogenase
MLANEQLDIVSVCTTARVRAQIVQDVARAGVKAIWAEKPIALTLEDADAMVRTCREQGVALAINCSRRWNPSFSQMRRLIDEGRIGKVLQITAYSQCSLSHNGSHVIDIIRYLAGSEVEWVFGEMESDEAAATNDDLQGNGYLAFANGVRCYLRTTTNTIANWEVDVIGETGRLRSVANCADTEFYQFVEGGPRNRGQPAKIPFPMPAHIPGTGVAVVEDLVNAIETGSDPKCSGEDGLAALEIAMALRESHRRGGIKVTLPLADRSLTMLSIEIRGDEVPARIRRLQRA